MPADPAAMRFRDWVHCPIAMLARQILRFTTGLRIEWGAMPRGGFVLAANHRSFFDPILGGMSTRRQLHYFARANLWRIPPIRMALDLFGGVPVERDRPDMATMTAAVAVLRRHRPLLMFPEGTRSTSGRLGRLREGPALIARRAGVPVVPCYLHGGDRLWPRGSALPRLSHARLQVVYGPAITGDPALPPRERDTAVTAAVTDWLTAQERRFLGGPS